MVEFPFGIERLPFCSRGQGKFEEIDKVANDIFK
jgi:hypothetical protein